MITQSNLPPSEAPTLARWTEKFETLARLNPKATAIITASGTLSYGELSRKSNRIANLLRQRGIGQGQFVGLGFNRSLDLVAAQFGILKAGAAYVPLDPGYPPARIGQMITSATLRHVVTTTDLASSFPGVELITIDSGTPDDVSSDQPDLSHGHDDLVYAIFTSGSTGQPKAASVYHRGFANLLDWYCQELNLGGNDTTLVTSSPSFDLTQKNFFAPLLSGGTLVLDECQTYDITRISALIQNHGVTLINCTPSAFYPLVEAAAANGYAALSTLRFAVLGGEPISIPRLRTWLEHPSCIAEVMNSYGPTECTDICAFHRLHRGNLDDHGFVPLGREIPHVQVTIRDEAMELLPDGEIGELCISGAGVGGGYLNDPEKTSLAFKDSVYRTGDLARRLVGGILEFRGRADHQVKVNGFRIELGEIEIALSKHDAVKEAVVVAHGNRLIAHIQGTVESTVLREHLATLLPAYMVPGEFVSVLNFPLTPNGKVDRLALTAASSSTAPALESGISLESKILALWSEILDRTVTDATSNFFDLGGNSIHLAVVHVRLSEMTGKDFPITELFARSTARSIADFLSPAATNVAMSGARDRARMAQAGFSRFRPANR